MLGQNAQKRHDYLMDNGWKQKKFPKDRYIKQKGYYHKELSPEVIVLDMAWLIQTQNEA